MKDDKDSYTEPEWQLGDIVVEEGIEYGAQWARVSKSFNPHMHWLCIYHKFKPSWVGKVYTRDQLPKRLVKLTVERREDI